MLHNLLIWLLIALAVETLTELIVTENILVRRAVSRLSNNLTIGEILHCGSCASLLVSAPMCWVLPGTICNDIVLDYAIKLLVISRISNIIHEILMRLFHRVPFHFVISSISSNGENHENKTSTTTGNNL